MSEITNLILEASDGTLYSTERYEFQPERHQVDQTAERAPFSESWFLVGDGKRRPSTLRFAVQIRASELRSAIDELQHLKGVLELIETVRWGEYSRAMLGLARVVPQQTLRGYRVDIEVWPSGPKWVDDHGTEVEL